MALFSALRENAFWAAIALIPLFWVGQIVYRLYFHPLAKFPGPKLAAASLWYTFYYDVVLEGRYTFKLLELHEKYGPIVRVAPNELHITAHQAPDFYQELYSLHEPRDKSIDFLNAFQLHGASFGTVDHKLHRLRRSAINPFFSKQSVNNLQQVFTYFIEKLCARIEEYRSSGEVLAMRVPYVALSTDCITTYALNHTWNHLDSKDFSPFWAHTIHETARGTHFSKQFPWVLPLVRHLPLRVAGWIHAGVQEILRWERSMRDETKRVMDGTYQYSTLQEKLGVKRTIFHALAESELLPPSEKDPERIWQEGFVLIGAGADPAANVSMITHYFLLANPNVLQKLQAELRTAMPDKYAIPNLQDLEKLPYLSAVINEGLRLSYGASTRLPRISYSPMRFGDWVIPAGTPVGMSSYHMHHNEDIFPDSFAFKPERWLEDRKEGAPSLERYLVSFTKGSRQCAGLNFAKAQLYLTMAMIFRRFEDQQLVDKSRLDVDLKHDNFIPHQDHGAKGVRVFFR